MRDNRAKRLSIAEKRELRDDEKPILEPDYVVIEGSYTTEIEPDWHQAVVVGTPAKTPISLRLDPDILEFFKEDGAGYQTRMNAVLRAYMVAQRKVTRR